MWTPSQFKTVLLVHQPKTVSISDIFKVSDDSGKFILIEGAPGIGKTTLAREMAYRWACEDLLSSEILLLLLCLRDPDIFKLQSIDDLPHYIFGNKAVSCSDKHAEYILDRDGKNVTIILDGYDELPSYYFIINLFDRRIMLQCTIVVTAQPTASVKLHESANIRVDILGFTEESKQSFFLGELICYLNKLQANSNLHQCYYVPNVLAQDLPEENNYLWNNHYILRPFATISTLHKCMSIANSYLESLLNALLNWKRSGFLRFTKRFIIEEIDTCAMYNFSHLSIQGNTFMSYIIAISSSQLPHLLKKHFFQNKWIIECHVLCRGDFIYIYSLPESTFRAWNETFIALKLSNKIFKFCITNCHVNSNIIDTILVLIGRCCLSSQLYIWKSDFNNDLYLSSTISSNKGMLLCHVDSFSLFQDNGKCYRYVKNAYSAEKSYMLCFGIMEFETEELKSICLLHFKLNSETASQLERLIDTCKLVFKSVTTDHKFHTRVLQLCVDTVHSFQNLFVYCINVEIFRVKSKLSFQHLLLSIVDQNILSQLNHAINANEKCISLMLKHCFVRKCENNFFNLIEQSQNPKNVQKPNTLNNKETNADCSITTIKRTIQGRNLGNSSFKILNMLKGNLIMKQSFKVLKIFVIKEAANLITFVVSSKKKPYLNTIQFLNNIAKTQIIAYNLNLNCVLVFNTSNDFLNDEQFSLHFSQLLIYKYKCMDVQCNQITKENAESLVNSVKQSTELQEKCLDSNSLHLLTITFLRFITKISYQKLCNINDSEKMSYYLSTLNTAKNKVCFNDNHLCLWTTTASHSLSALYEHDVSIRNSKWEKFTNSILTVTISNSHFTSLGFINSNLQSKDVSIIAQAVSSSNVSALNLLIFQDIQIIDTVTKASSSVVLQNIQLQKIYLANDLLYSITKNIIKALAKISSLKIFNLNSNFLSRKGTDDLVSANGLLNEMLVKKSYSGSSLIAAFYNLKTIVFLKEFKIKCKYENVACKIPNVFEAKSEDWRSKKNLKFNSLIECAGVASKNLSVKVLDIRNKQISTLLSLFVDFRRDKYNNLAHEFTALWFTTLLPYYGKFLNPDLQLNIDIRYISIQLYPNNFACKRESSPLQLKYSLLIAVSNRIFCKDTVTGLNATRCQELTEQDVQCDVFRPFGKQITPDVKPVNQQSVTNSMSHQQPFEYQGNYSDTGGTAKANGHVEGRQQDLLQSSATTENRHQPLQIQNECYRIPPVNVNVQDQSDVQKDGPPPLPRHKTYENLHVSSYLEPDCTERDGKLSIASGIDQATQISSIPSEHKLMIGNVPSKPLGSADSNRSGGHIVKALPKQTELLPTVGPQLDALYNTNFEHEVQSSREEVRQKRNARTTFYQHEFEQHAYNPLKIGEINPPKNPPLNDKLQVKVSETGKAANDFKPKPLPKRSCIVCGSKQYPLVNNLISHPHMDHYFVKERTEIRPSHYLAKLVLRHQYLNRYVLYLRMFYFAA